MEQNTFEINLYDPRLQEKQWSFQLNDDFFAGINGLIQRGNIHTEVRCTHTSDSHFSFSIHSEGIVTAPCDRCLSDIELRIDTTDSLQVCLDENEFDDGDVFYVSQRTGLLNLTQPIYEFIALSLPVRLVHAPGKCDQAMMQVIEQHQPVRSSEENEEE